MSQLLHAAAAAGRGLVRTTSSTAATMVQGRRFMASSTAATAVHGIRRSMASSAATTVHGGRSMASSAVTTAVHGLRRSMASSAATTVHGGRSMASSCRCRETMEGRWMITLAKWGLIWTVGNVVVDMRVEDETASIREEMLLLEEASSIREQMLLVHASNAEVQASNDELQEMMEPYINRWRAKKEEN